MRFPAPGAACVPDAGEEIGDGVCVHERNVKVSDVNCPLPGALFYARNQTAAGEFPETDAAEIKTSHVASDPAAEPASVIYLSRQVRFFAGDERFHEAGFLFLLAYFEGFACHRGWVVRSLLEFTLD